MRRRRSARRPAKQHQSIPAGGEQNVQSRQVRRMRWYRAKARARCAMAGPRSESAKRSRRSLWPRCACVDTRERGRDATRETASD